MDYLSRILLELPRRNEDARLPRLTEAILAAAGAQETAPRQVSPAAVELGVRTAELSAAFSALEAQTRNLQTHASPAQEKTADAAAQEQPSGAMGAVRYVLQEDAERFSVPETDAERLSRIFQRDARRYG